MFLGGEVAHGIVGRGLRTEKPRSVGIERTDGFVSVKALELGAQPRQPSHQMQVKLRFGGFKSEIVRRKVGFDISLRGEPWPIQIQEPRHLGPADGYRCAEDLQQIWRKAHGAQFASGEGPRRITGNDRSRGDPARARTISPLAWRPARSVIPKGLSETAIGSDFPRVTRGCPTSLGRIRDNRGRGRRTMAGTPPPLTSSSASSNAASCSSSEKGVSVGSVPRGERRPRQAAST